jgi:hypothetical protein
LAVGVLLNHAMAMCLQKSLILSNDMLILFAILDFIVDDFFLTVEVNI